MRFLLLSHLCCVPKHIGMNEGFLSTTCSILNAISEVLVEECNGNHVRHVLVCIWVFCTWKCEAVNFPKFKSAGMLIRPFKYLGVPILLRAHVPCMHACM